VLVAFGDQAETGNEIASLPTHGPRRQAIARFENIPLARHCWT
jgi:hypothetical protein